MDGTILSQGTFTQPATAVNQIIAVPSGVDWIKVYNKTQIDSASASTGMSFYWQKGMPAGYAIEYQSNGASTAVNIISQTTGGFTLYDPSAQTPGSQPLLSAAVAYTAITNVTQPVVSTASTAGLSSGTTSAPTQIVRLSLQSGDTALANDVSGIDFAIGTVVTNTSFVLNAEALATAPGLTTGTGHYRIVNFDPLFYPRRRNIVKITAANPTVVFTSIPHGYVNGQLVRFVIPAVSGMTQLNGLTGTVTVDATDKMKFTVNIDSSAFTAFTFPTVAQQPSSFPLVIPVGEDTAGALAFSPVPDLLSDATVNTGFLGVILPSGINSPGGQANDVVFWVAGKSSFGGQ